MNNKEKITRLEEIILGHLLLDSSLFPNALNAVNHTPELEVGFFQLLWHDRMFAHMCELYKEFGSFDAGIVFESMLVSNDIDISLEYRFYEISNDLCSTKYFDKYIELRKKLILEEKEKKEASNVPICE